MNSPQIDLGASMPRLHLWNSDTVSCLTNLDSQCSFPPSFGRLPVCTNPSYPYFYVFAIIALVSN
jgi:hypothetical protein